MVNQKNNKFISAWKLAEEQAFHMERNGKLT